MYKKITLVLLPILFLITQAIVLAADVKLAWDPNTEPELKGYYVYYGTASGDYTQKEDAGNQTTYTVSGLTEGTTYYFAVTAYSDTVESDYSDEITYQVPVPVVTYTLTASAGANGSIDPSGSITVNQNTNQTFTITPATNYHVADVKVDGTSMGAITTYTFSNITANHTIEATFAADIYTISATAGANGSISPAGSVAVNAGGSKTFTITPATNYHVANVKVDGTSRGAINSYTFSNVIQNHTIEATFAIDTYTISATAGDNGSISPTGSVTVNAGTSKTFSIAPANGYHIADVKVDGTSRGAINSYTFSAIEANHSIAAFFEKDAAQTYTINATAGSYGSISPSGTVTVEEGHSQTFTITSSRLYRVDDVRVDGVSIGAVNSYTLAGIRANHTITVSFKMGLTPCGEVTLAWNPSADPAVRGYKVRYGTTVGAYDTIIDTGSSVSCSISGLAFNQQYYLKITAYTANGESDYSEEFTYDTCAYKTLPPPMLKLLGLR